MQACAEQAHASGTNLHDVLCCMKSISDSLVCAMQEHAEQAHMVRQLVIEANTLVQQAPQLQVRLDKDIEKLKVSRHSLQCALFLCYGISVWHNSCICCIHTALPLLACPRLYRNELL